MVAEWEALEARMLDVRARMKPEQLDAYYQLIEFPISAMANLYRLYYAAAWNRLLASSNDARANYFADQAEAAFARDSALTARYHSLRGGKWDGMMAQVHMSYVIWNDPTQQTMPSIMRVGADTPAEERGRQPKFIKRSGLEDGVIAVAATRFSRAYDWKGLRWTAIPHLGRDTGAVVALPQGQAASEGHDGPRLEYDLTVTRGGPATLTLYLATTLDTLGHRGIRIGLSWDDAPMQVLQAELEPTGGAQNTPAKKSWAGAVCDNVVRLSASADNLPAGRHTVKIWRIDDNVVLQKLVVSTVALPPSYLGPGAGRA